MFPHAADVGAHGETINVAGANVREAAERIGTVHVR